MVFRLKAFTSYCTWKFGFIFLRMFTSALLFIQRIHLPLSREYFWIFISLEDSEFLIFYNKRKISQTKFLSKSWCIAAWLENAIIFFGPATVFFLLPMYVHSCLKARLNSTIIISEHSIMYFSRSFVQPKSKAFFLVEFFFFFF